MVALLQTSFYNGCVELPPGCVSTFKWECVARFVRYRVMQRMSTCCRWKVVLFKTGTRRILCVSARTNRERWCCQVLPIYQGIAQNHIMSALELECWPFLQTLQNDTTCASVRWWQAGQLTWTSGHLWSPSQTTISLEGMYVSLWNPIPPHPGHWPDSAHSWSSTLFLSLIWHWASQSRMAIMWLGHPPPGQ